MLKVKIDHIRIIWYYLNMNEYQQPLNSDIQGQIFNQEASPSIDLSSQEISYKSKKKRDIIPLVILGLLVLIAVFCIGVYLLGYKNIDLSKKRGCTLEALQCPDGSVVGRTGPNCEFSRCPDVPTDPTSGWKIYEDGVLGIEYKLPPTMEPISNTKNYITYSDNEQTATQYCVTYGGSLSFLVKRVFAGGSPCEGGIFSIGSVSKNYSAGRDTGFGDSTGYQKKEGGYYIRIFQTVDSSSIPSSLVNELTNTNGVTYLKVKGENTLQDWGGTLVNVATRGTPGEGYLGAIINIQNADYDGFNIKMKTESKSDSLVFDEILSTLKFK